MKVLSIFGTRPETVKMAPIVRALEEDPRFQSKICVTAQHRQMMDQFLQVFGLEPDHDLNIMAPQQDLFDITSKALLGLREILILENPDLVLVQGDTTTTLAGAMAAFYRQIPVGHVEAGLRTNNLRAPFPEEGNRSLTTRISELHFAPTETSKENLLREGVDPEKIFVTGNTVIDALCWVRDRILKKFDLDQYADLFGSSRAAIESDQKLILVTGHRRENWGEGFDSICRALAQIAQNHPDWQIVYPVHLNPKVQEPVKATLSEFRNVHLIPPLHYEPFVYLMNRSDLILTDSGGVQEEAPSLGKPVLVMRETTERPEAVRAGTVLLVGTDPEKITRQTEALLTDSVLYQKMSQAHNPYGDGKATARILDAIAHRFLDQ